jgi:TonB-dependent SusC/RagA subfamily outer membrane receptor
VDINALLIKLKGHMRKIAPFITMLMLLCTLAFGQTRKVSGTVRDANGNPIPFATITETGTSNAVTADADGKFEITVSQKNSLSITSTGYRAQTVRPSGSTVNVSMARGEGQLQEVVVTTALGIRRNRNTLPYAAQTVDGDMVSQSRTNNLTNALSGKVSGVEIRTGNAMGASSNVVVRGVKSLSYSNQALFVIDGVPFENAINNTTGSVDPDRNQTGGRGGFDYGNAAADINPDDVESITVLKGAAATALYGSRAANGVVMINTKKARRGLGITINSGVTVGRIDKDTYTKYQKEYGAGYSTTGYGTPSGPFWNHFDVDGDGVKDPAVPSTEDASYGARFDPNVMVYHWDAFDVTSPNYKKTRPWVAAENDPLSFFETAVSTINSAFIDGGDEKASFKLGYTRNDEKGILPNSKLLKNLVNFGASYKIIDQLTAAASLNFSGFTFNS